MWFIVLLSYVAIVVHVVFATVAIAAGLYYLAELVEEYSVTAKRCIWWLNLATTLMFLGLWLFEGLPFSMVCCGLVSQACHFVILTNFPFVSLTSPTLITAVAFIFVNHYFAFQYFAEVYHPFSEVMAYFTLCLWLVPFALFVSLSANENVLPTVTERKKYGLLTLYGYVKELIAPHAGQKRF